jgi:hypothetical protein
VNPADIHRQISEVYGENAMNDGVEAQLILDKAQILADHFNTKIICTVLWDRQRVLLVEF